jgi:hypothetical protein
VDRQLHAYLLGDIDFLAASAFVLFEKVFDLAMVGFQQGDGVLFDGHGNILCLGSLAQTPGGFNRFPKS